MEHFYILLLTVTFRAIYRVDQSDEWSTRTSSAKQLNGEFATQPVEGTYVGVVLPKGIGKRLQPAKQNQKYRRACNERDAGVT